MVDVTGLPYAEARALQKTYYRDHGTTLHGLMLHHGVDPDHFLKTVHAIDYSGVPAHPGWSRRSRRCPGRKFILTNGDVGHASACSSKVGARGAVRRHLRYPRDELQAQAAARGLRGVLCAHGIDAKRAAMFDDLEKNLLVPHEVGMITVQVVAGRGFRARPGRELGARAHQRPARPPRDRRSGGVSARRVGRVAYALGSSAAVTSGQIVGLLHHGPALFGAVDDGEQVRDRRARSCRPRPAPRS